MLSSLCLGLGLGSGALIYDLLDLFLILALFVSKLGGFASRRALSGSVGVGGCGQGLGLSCMACSLLSIGLYGVL